MSDRAIWHVPLLILAGIAAIAGIGVAIAVWQKSLPEPIGPALQWGLAGASLTFTLARIIHIGTVGRRELELFGLAAAIILAQFFLAIAAVILVIGFIGLILEEL
jgi:hypothetical protein